MHTFAIFLKGLRCYEVMVNRVLFLSLVVPLSPAQDMSDLDNQSWKKAITIYEITGGTKHIFKSVTVLVFHLRAISYLQDYKSAYHRGPPHIEDLWWISFQVITLCIPVVMEVPMVKTRRCSNARRSMRKTRFPSGLSGRYATRSVPGYLTPGFGCSCWNHLKIWWLTLAVSP